MKNINIYLVILLGFGALITACKKEHEHTNESTITIANPLAGTIYNQGDTVFINATITAAEAMHGWEIKLKNKTADVEVFSDEEHAHAATYSIAGYWVNNVTADSDMELEITATIDHDGNTANKKVDFHCHQ